MPPGTDGGAPLSTPRRHLGAGAALSVLVQGAPLVAAGVLSIVIARTIGPSGNGHLTGKKAEQALQVS